MNLVDWKRINWRRKLFDELWGQIIDEASWSSEKVDWQKKLIDKENWLTKKVDW